MRRRLVAEVLGEALHERVEVVCVRGCVQGIEEHTCVVRHPPTPLFGTMTCIRYSTMDPKTTQVKRRYDGSGRRAQAERTRAALIDAARELLLSEGYGATTVARVAAACQVSVESVYKRFGGKPGLVRAVVDNALRGVGPVSAEERSDALPVTDPEALLRGWGRLAAEVVPQVAPVLLLVRAAAAHDPEVATLGAELDEARRARMTANARRL